MQKHSDASLGARHALHNWEYSNETERTSASGFASSDIGKTARQTDNETYWVLTATTPSWSQLNGAGSGGVSGPGSSTDNAVARFDGSGGSAIQNSSVTIDDSGNVVTPGTVDGRDVSVDGATLDGHVGDTSSNPHSVTKSQVGLSSVPNLDTTDAVTNEHTHSNKSELDLISDGDHDVRSDNPHAVMAVQAGAIPSPIAASIEMNNNSFTEIKTATFNSVPTLTPSSGTMTCAFDEYQKAKGNLNNVATVTIQLNMPTGPGNFMLVLIQGSTTPTTTINWATEGAYALWGNVTIPPDTGARVMVGLFFDGSVWYATSTTVVQMLAS